MWSCPICLNMLLFYSNLLPLLWSQGSSWSAHQEQERLCWPGPWLERPTCLSTTPPDRSLMRCLWASVRVESGTSSVSLLNVRKWKAPIQPVAKRLQSLPLSSSVCRRGQSQRSLCHLHRRAGQRRWEENRVSHASLFETNHQPAAGWNGWVSFMPFFKLQSVKKDTNPF